MFGCCYMTHSLIFYSENDLAPFMRAQLYFTIGYHSLLIMAASLFVFCHSIRSMRQFAWPPYSVNTYYPWIHIWVLLDAKGAAGRHVVPLSNRGKRKNEAFRYFTGLDWPCTSPSPVPVVGCCCTKLSTRITERGLPFPKTIGYSNYARHTPAPQHKYNHILGQFFFFLSI